MPDTIIYRCTQIIPKSYALTLKKNRIYVLGDS